MSGFDWDAIESYGDDEVAMYRLIGEMLQNRATLDDLEQIREFLLRGGPEPSSWESVGEALYRTTSGSPAGYDIWTAWIESTGLEISDDRLGDEWAHFGDEVSEASDFDANVDFVPGRPSIESDEFPVMEYEDDTATDVISRRPVTGVLAESPTLLLRMMPTGPYDVRIFGREYVGIDEYTILALIKRGLFLGMSVRFGDGWIPAWEHPAFERISGRLQGEAFKILARDDGRSDPDVTIAD